MPFQRGTVVLVDQMKQLFHFLLLWRQPTAAQGLFAKFTVVVVIQMPGFVEQVVVDVVQQGRCFGVRRHEEFLLDEFLLGAFHVPDPFFVVVLFRQDGPRSPMVAKPAVQGHPMGLMVFEEFGVLPVGSAGVGGVGGGKRDSATAHGEMVWFVG